MFYDLIKINAIHPLFAALERCRGIPQSEKWHPEGDVFEHSLQTLDHALRETSDIDLIFAAMLHDVGKIVRPHGHEKYSVNLLGASISEKTRFLIANHMRIATYINGQMRKQEKCIDIGSHIWLREMILLLRFDKMGRNPNKNLSASYSRKDIIEKIHFKTTGESLNLCQ